MPTLNTKFSQYWFGGNRQRALLDIYSNNITYNIIELVKLYATKTIKI